MRSCSVVCFRKHKPSRPNIVLTQLWLRITDISFNAKEKLHVTCTKRVFRKTTEYKRKQLCRNNQQKCYWHKLKSYLMREKRALNTLHRVNNSVQQCTRSSETLRWFRQSMPFMELEGSSLCSQGPDNGPYPEPGRPSLHALPL
jgi:hypothetical protein